VGRERATLQQAAVLREKANFKVIRINFAYTITAVRQTGATRPYVT
jgi:hypothetical protein